MSKPIYPGTVLTVRRGEIRVGCEDVVVDPAVWFTVTSNCYGRVSLLADGRVLTDVLFYEPPEILF